MRTLVVVIALVGLALAAGGSFVVRAQDGSTAATLEGGCEPTTLPYAVPTLVHCRVTARNSGDTAIENARTLVLPTSGTLPDAYYFFRASRDGIGQPVGNGQIEYDYGDLAPGASRTLTVDVIVVATHGYQAQALLLDGDTGGVLTSVAVGADVTSAAPPAPVDIELSRDVTRSGQAPAFTLVVRNTTDSPVRDVSIDLAPGSDVALRGTPGWTASDAPGHEQYHIGELRADDASAQRLTFARDGACPVAYPAVVVMGESDSGAFESAAISVGWAPLGACGMATSQTAAPHALPSTGSGRASSHPFARDAALGLAIGLLCIAAGISVRRSRP
jgi:hypothetical protein